NGIQCDNARCISKSEAERRYLSPRFFIVEESPLVLRCVYCDYERAAGIVSSITTRHFYSNTRRMNIIKPGNLVLFATAADARAAGHLPAKGEVETEHASG